MLGVFKPQLLGGGGDARAADEQLLGLTHNEPANDVAGRVICHLADQVAKVVGREEKLLGTVFYRGEPVGELLPLVVITLQEILKAREQVAGRLYLHGELTGIVSRYVLKNQLKVSRDNMLCVAVGLRKLFAHGLHQADDGQPLLSSHQQRLVGVV